MKPNFTTNYPQLVFYYIALLFLNYYIQTNNKQRLTMIYSNKQSLKPEKVVSKPINIANLINQRMSEKQKLQQSNKRPFLKIHKLSINSGVLALSITHQQRDTRSLRQYVEILQQSQKRLKHQNQILTNSLKDMKGKQSDDNLIKQTYFYGLQEYYSKSRKLMLQSCFQLVDCKGVLLSYSQSAKFGTRIQNISKLLTKIQVFIKGSSIQIQRKNIAQQQEKTNLRQLKETISIQQKTIKHLRQLNKYPSQQTFEQERRLLRYEINRLFTQNQKLREQCGMTYSQFLTKLKSKDLENQRVILNQTVREYFELMDGQLQLKDMEYRHKVEKQFVQNRLEDEKNNNKKFENEIQQVRQQNSNLIIQNKRLKDHNRSLIQEGAKRQEIIKKNNQLSCIMSQQLTRLSFEVKRLSQQNLAAKQQIVEAAQTVHNSKQQSPSHQKHQKSVRESELEEEVNDLKEKLLVTQVLLQQTNSRLRQSKQCDPQEKQEVARQPTSPIRYSHNINSLCSLEHSIQQKIVFLQQYLRQNSEQYYLIFREYKRKIQKEATQQQTLMNKQNQQKEMILNWCKKVYLLLKRSDIPEQTIQSHLIQLQQLQKQKKTKPSKLGRLLESVKQCSEKLDKQQQREIQEQLEEYIETLNKRGDVIQEVSNEDGSSVATVTDFRSEAFTDFEQRSFGEND